MAESFWVGVVCSSNGLEWRESEEKCSMANLGRESRCLGTENRKAAATCIELLGKSSPLLMGDAGKDREN